MPGETEETIRETIDYAKELPLDIALFHIAAPYPGTPFFYEVVQNNWFRPGTKWEEVDMDKSTVLDYENITAERLEYWQKRATREWSLRPGPMWTFAKGLNSWEGFKSAMNVGWQMLNFLRDNSACSDGTYRTPAQVLLLLPCAGGKTKPATYFLGNPPFRMET